MHPVRRNGAKIIVRGDDVHLWPMLLDRPINQNAQLPPGRGAGDKGLLVASATLLQRGIEIWHAVGLHDRPDRFARRRCQTREQRVDIVLQDRRRRVLGVFGQLGLGIIAADHCDRLSQHAACRVDIFHGKLKRVVLPDAKDVQATCQVENRADPGRCGCCRRAKSTSARLESRCFIR